MRRSHPDTTRATVLWALAATTVVVALLAYRRRAGRPRRAHDQPAAGPITQATVPRNPADLALGSPGRNIDRRLDEAIEETFPASDPISVHIE